MKNIYQAKGTTLAEQYRDVGKLFAPTIQKEVNKIAKSRAGASKIRRQVAERVLQNLQTKPECREFLECLSMWCEGSGIQTKEAMWLLADNLSGCQTLLVRYGSGVALIHTEEEFIDAKHTQIHLAKQHTISFTVNGVAIKALVYNDLLPGAGLFGWKKDFIVAVDSLFVREDEINEVKRPLLSNVISWLIWRMDPEEADPEKILKLINSLGELVDGYTINVVRKVGSNVSGYKLTLVRSDNRIEYLGSETGSYLKQVNIVDPKYPLMKWATAPKNIWRGGWKFFLGRLKTIDKHVLEYAKFAKLSLNKQKVALTHRAIHRTLFTDLRSNYINPDLGAICVGLVDKDTTSVSTKLNDKRSAEVLEYVDKL